MTSFDVICERIHAGHAPRWCARWERATACVACVVEMIDRPDVSAVRKRAALVCVTRAEAVRELLYCEETRGVNFTCSLLRMLSCCVELTLLDQAVEVLLQMTLDRPQFLHFILDNIHSQLSDGGRLNVFMFLGKLMDCHPALSQTLTSSHLCVLECVCAGLLVSDEEVKVAVCYVLFRIWSSASAVHKLPNTLRDKMCVLLLHTLSNTQTTALTINCLGVLKQMLQYSDVVCVLMSEGECDEEQLLDQQPLPLIIKKLLLSAQDSVQLVSIRCVCAVLIDSPARFSSSFIQADLPEFLFERVCSSSEMMMWWIFRCLLLMSEDPLFFSQCHSVYGIESLVRSLKETLGKANTEVQKQGLELLTAILDRCLYMRCEPLLFSSVSSGFIRLTLENKAQLCSENRKASLNLICCEFLIKLCMCVFAHLHNVTTELQDHVECVLQECLSSLCCSVSDWCCVLLDSSESIRNTQYCIIYLLYASLLHGHRLLCDAAVFSSVLQFISVQDVSDVSVPSPVQCCVVYLLSVTHHSCPHVDTSAVKSISKALSCSPLLFSFSSVHPSILSFIFCYPELSERLGVRVLTGCLSAGSEAEDLLQLLRDRPAALLSMLVVLCEADAAVAHRAEVVLRCLVWSSDRSSSCDVSHQMKSALLNLLQKLTHTDFRVCVLLDVLSVLQSNTTAQSEMNHTDFKLLYHVCNLVVKVNSSDSELLLSVLNCLYCFLSVCPSHCTDRVVSLLLGNIRLMEVLENVFSHSSSSSSSLQCCSLLLLATLISLQHTLSAQVYRNITVDLHKIVRRLAFRKRHTDSLLLMCSMRLLQVWLDVDECSLVCVCQSAAPVRSVDGALYPLCYSGAQALMTALCGLMLQKQDVMMSSTVKCLTSLIGFLHRRDAVIAQHMVCQPWTRFLLFSLLSCGGIITLHPAVLTLITLLVCVGGGFSEWKTEVQSVCKEVETRGVTQIKDNSINTLRLLLTRCCALAPPDDLKTRMENLLESLQHQQQSCDSPPPQHMLCVDGVCVLLSDFTVNTQIV
ncbi:putative meiosis inhibitor protein 1 [Triplophysa rosa]|uniref:Meiosis inhibitor protein 1 n=1 Tax=Triplophysa rosa TaxID=992332 RepID=A0A9W7TV16_TRIRA|nr:putative meiosis inhibitor protein 1 [Triplophysa rosa]